MSQQNALKFIEDIRYDTATRQRLSQLPPGDVEGVVDIAMLSGYEFTADEYRAAVREYQRREPMAEGGGPFSHVPGFNR